MTHLNTLRPAMTALAAVFALSSTPSFAQSIDEPVVTTTPVVDEAPVPVAADPIVPVDASAAADPLAASAAPATTARKATAVKTVAKARPAATARAASAPVAAAPAVATPVPAITAPVDAPTAAEPVTAIAAPPVFVDAPAEPADTSFEEALPVVGIGGLALVLLAGTGLAFRRRRRRAQEAEDAAWQQDEALVAEPVAEPALAAEPTPDLESTRPVFATPAEPAHAVASATTAAAAMAPEVDGPVTELPEDFDLSRFGYNVQQAYKGPTEDNPSLSLKHRLRRASGMDQQERKLDAEVEAVTGESPLAEDEAAAGTSANGDFLLKPESEQPTGRPALTH